MCLGSLRRNFFRTEIVGRQEKGTRRAHDTEMRAPRQENPREWPRVTTAARPHGESVPQAFSSYVTIQCHHHAGPSSNVPPQRRRHSQQQPRHRVVRVGDVWTGATWSVVC
jgi:hypothetical protein